MKQAFLIAGAAALAVAAAPAAAKPGKGHGNHGKHGSHAAMGHVGYGNGHCPPGLAKKNERCMPPGQYKKLYNVGQRFPVGYGTAWSYDQIPYDWRQQYGLDPASRYYYGDGYLYRVDPRTALISEVVRAILR